MNIPIPFIGGGGDGSDDCTAVASDVLEGKTAIYDGSDDEPAAGTMKDYSGTTQSATASLDDSNNRVQMAVPNTGKYDTAARLYSGYSTIASLIGLTADKIKWGENILGITGTWEGYVPRPGDLYYQGMTGSLGGGIYQIDQSSDLVQFEDDCIAINPDGVRPGSEIYVGIAFANNIDLTDYNTLTLIYQVNTAGVDYPYGPQNQIWLGVYNDRPDSSSSLYYSSAYSYNIDSTLTVGEFTMTLDISNISRTLYVAIGCNFASGTNYTPWRGAITRVSIS